MGLFSLGMRDLEKTTIVLNLYCIIKKQGSYSIWGNLMWHFAADIPLTI